MVVKEEGQEKMVDIIPTPKTNIVLDATTLSSMMSCARYYDIRFNHRLVSMKGKSNSLELGLLIHKVLEVYYKHKIKGFPQSVAVAQGLTAGQLSVTGCAYCADGTNPAPSCKHEPGEYPGLTNTPEYSGKVETAWGDKQVTGWRFALETCEKYFEFYESKDSFIPLNVEYVDGEVLYENEEIRVLWKAKFDLIIDTNQIGIISMDHKTFKQRRDKTSLSNQFMGQCCILKSRNVLVNKIGLQSSLKIEDRLSREMISYSADRLQEWQNEILPYYAYRYIEYQESQYYPPDFTHCDTMFGPCPYKRVCESNRNMREEMLRQDFQIGPIWDPTNKEDE